MFTLVLPPADLFVLSNTFLSRMYIVCLFSCIFSANSPRWVWMLARLIECVAFCWIGRTLFENQQPHRQRWEDTDLREIFNIFHVRLHMDFGILEKNDQTVMISSVFVLRLCLIDVPGLNCLNCSSKGEGGILRSAVSLRTPWALASYNISTHSKYWTYLQLPILSVLRSLFTDWDQGRW